MTRADLLERFATMPDRLAADARATAGHPVAPGEWGPVEVAGHLVAVEREVWWTRFATLAAATDGEEPLWSWTEPGPDPSLDGASLDTALARFAEVRARTLAILDGFDDATWARTGVHATYGRLDATGLIRLAVGHDEEHLTSLGV